MRVRLDQIAFDENGAADPAARHRALRDLGDPDRFAQSGAPAGPDRTGRLDRAEVGLFVTEREGEPLATAICVHDGELAGLFEVAPASGSGTKGMAARSSSLR